MQPVRHVAPDGGIAFEDGADRGRVLVSGRDTGGLYSLMEYIAAPEPPPVDTGAAPGFGAHRHWDFEETFLVQSGNLAFLLEDEVLELAAGDFVRVPPGVRHGYANLSGEPVHMLVSFHPGGFEELFLRHRSDQEAAPRPLGFVEDAVRMFGSEFEDFPDVR